MENKIIYDSFNARYLSFQEVAESFIPNTYFDDLFENTHSLLMGPRGSGKTTLLKMLSPAALIHWDKTNKTNLFGTIPFFAIYIPTDVHWKKQLDQLNEDFKGTNFLEIISRATVNTNILLSTVKTFSFLIKSAIINAVNTVDREIQLAKTIIDEWKLDKPIAPTLDSIEISLLSKISKINLEIKKRLSNPEYVVNFDDFYYSEYLDLLQIAFARFSQLFPELNGKRWALCFDELEIAPRWLQDELLGILRSRNQNILFKLTTAPLVSFYKDVTNEVLVTQATERNDFKTIRVWTSNNKEFRNWYEFCNKLVISRLKRKYESYIDPEKIFGNSNLDRLIRQSFPTKIFEEGRSDFDDGTATLHLLRELANIDPTFSEFIKRKGINIYGQKKITAKQKDEVFRKLKQIAIYRYQFKKSGQKRSRKVTPLYYGLPLIYELCDGNPRILIGMVDDFLAMSKTPNGFSELTINSQSRKLAEISNNYISVISAHPDANKIIKDQNYNIRTLLEQIGNYFHDRMIQDSFSIDPVGSFKVDIEINNKLLELLEVALYLGAIVYLDSTEPISSHGLIGKQFRLSYTLSPYFGLLSREYSSINLSTILSQKRQPSLFSDYGTQED